MEATDQIIFIVTDNFEYIFAWEIRFIFVNKNSISLHNKENSLTVEDYTVHGSSAWKRKSGLQAYPATWINKQPLQIQQLWFNGRKLWPIVQTNILASNDQVRLDFLKIKRCDMCIKSVP